MVKQGIFTGGVQIRDLNGYLVAVNGEVYATSNTGGTTNAFLYQAKTNITSGDPGSGHIIWNNATQTSATQLNVSHLTDSPIEDIDIFLSAIIIGTKLIVQDRNDSGSYQTWTVTSAPTQVGSTYWTIPASLVNSAGIGTTGFPNNHDLLFAIVTGGTGGGGITTNAVTFNNSGSGAASGTAFNGATAVTVSYNTLGAQAASSNLTSLSGLSYVSSALVRMTGANTFTLDTNTYLTANQTITISGDASGSGTTAISLTLANVNSNIGTFNNVTVNAKGLVTAASNVSYLTANQTITLSGDISGSGATAITTTIGANRVTLGMMAQVATATFLGRTTAGTGNVEALTVTQATALLNTFTSALKGLAPASGGGTTNFLRADGTWAAPSGGGTPGGSNTQVQYNNAGAFAGSANFTWDSSINRLYVEGNTILKGRVTVNPSATTVFSDRLFEISGTAGTTGSTQYAFVQNPTFGTPTTVYSWYNSLNVTSATTSYGLYYDTEGGSITNKWGLYFVGGSRNYLANTLLIGTTTDNGVDKLQVNGSVIATSYKVSGGTSSQILAADGSVITAGTGITISGGTISSSGGGGGTTTFAVTFNNSGTGAASGTTFDGSVARTISYNTIGANKVITSGSAAPTGGVDGDIYLQYDVSFLSGGGTTNYIPKFTSSTAIGNSQIFDNGTNVGIGTTSPGAKLDVNGVIRNNDRIIANANNANGTASINTFFNNTAIAQFCNLTNIANATQYGYMQGSDGTNYIAGSKNVFEYGNVGIGTASPTQKLHVVGNLVVDGGSSGYIIGASGEMLIGEDGAGLYVGTGLGVRPTIPIKYGHSATTEHNWFAGDAVARMVLNSSGNVGIGTASPDIYSLGTNRFVTVSNSTASGYSIFTVAGGSGGGGEIDFGNQTIRHAAIASLNGSALGFYTNGTNSGSAISERMRITSDGNVGIGTTSPQSTFHIGGTTTREASIGTVTFSGNAGQALASIQSDQTANGGVLYLKTNPWNNSSGVGLYTPQTRVTINDFGNVGIGYTAPAARLAVSGTTLINTNTDNGVDALQVSGNVTATQYSSTVQTLTDGATITFNASNGSNAVVTLGGNRTLAFSNTRTGGYYTLRVIQDGTGSRTLAMPGTVKVIGGGAGVITLTTTANAVDIISFYFDGTNYWASFGQNYT